MKLWDANGSYLTQAIATEFLFDCLRYRGLQRGDFIATKDQRHFEGLQHFYSRLMPAGTANPDDAKLVMEYREIEVRCFPEMERSLIEFRDSKDVLLGVLKNIGSVR